VFRTGCLLTSSGLLGEPAARQPLREPESEQENSDNEDNAEDDDDTGLLGGPVLTLGELGDSGVAEGEGGDGGHCVCLGGSRGD
jgi:hypothetical protein